MTITDKHDRTYPLSSVPRIAVIAGSTRPDRRAHMVADWVTEQSKMHLDGRAEVELVDLLDARLPLLDEPLPAALGQYVKDHTKAWARTIAGYDGFVFVTPEYNHSIPAALKNAIDYLFVEWNDKAAGFVSYGLNGGVRAVEHLRLTLAEVKVACVRSQVALGLFTDFDLPDITSPGSLAPAAYHGPVVERMLDEVLDWTNALRALRGTSGGEHA